MIDPNENQEKKNEAPATHPKSHPSIHIYIILLCYTPTPVLFKGLLFLKFTHDLKICRATEWM